MVSIVEDLKNYIKANFTNYATVQTDVLSSDDESICLRIDPSNVADKRYMNGDRFGITNFSMYCKSESKGTAINQLNSYINGLDLKEVPLTDNITISTEPVTEPHFVSQADDGALIYTAAFKLQYLYKQIAP